jgi:hypothetical protein
LSKCAFGRDVRIHEQHVVSIDDDGDGVLGLDSAVPDRGIDVVGDLDEAVGECRGAWAAVRMSVATVSPSNTVAANSNRVVGIIEGRVPVVCGESGGSFY